MSMTFVRELAAAADFDAVAHELTQSQKRLDNRLYTEAVLRLGRATEASVYAAADTFGIDPTVGIRELADLRRELTGTESLLLKSTTSEEVDDHLSNFAKRLKGVADEMRADIGKTNGKTGQSPRGSSRLLKDIHLNAAASHTKRKAKRTHKLLRHVMNARNATAHAAPSGQIQEVAANDIDRLCNNGAELITSIMMFALGQRSNAAGHK